ncbi:hypothetical protein BC829DRAFT_385671, partial [Chytridium lagenaria]
MQEKGVANTVFQCPFCISGQPYSTTRSVASLYRHLISRKHVDSSVSDYRCPRTDCGVILINASPVAVAHHVRLHLRKYRRSEQMLEDNSLANTVLNSNDDNSLENVEMDSNDHAHVHLEGDSLGFEDHHIAFADDSTSGGNETESETDDYAINIIDSHHDDDIYGGQSGSESENGNDTDIDGDSESVYIDTESESSDGSDTDEDFGSLFSSGSEENEDHENYDLSKLIAIIDGNDYLKNIVDLYLIVMENNITHRTYHAVASLP